MLFNTPKFRLVDVESANDLSVLLGNRALFANGDEDDGDEDDDDGKPDYKGMVASLKAKHGTLERALEHEARRHYNTREKLRKEKTAHEETKGKLPKDGEQVIVSKADADALAKYRELEKDPAALKTRLDKATETEARLAEESWKGLVKEAGVSAGFTNTTVLGALLKNEKLVVEMRDTTVVNGTKTEVKKMPFVVKVGDTKVDSPLATYVSTNLKAWESALKAGGDTKGGNDNGGGKSAVEYPAQGGAGGSNNGSENDGAGGGVKRHLAATYQSPLRKPSDSKAE